MLDLAQENLPQEVQLGLPKDRIKQWVSLLKDLVPKKPTKVIRALAHPELLLPDTQPSQEGLSSSLLLEPDLEKDSPEPEEENTSTLSTEPSTLNTASTLEVPPNPIEVFDSLGRAEASESNQPVIISHSLSCFPEDMVIYNRNQSNDVADWWKFIKNNSHRWETVVYREPNGNIRITFASPNNEFVREENGIRFDSRFATVSTRLKETTPEEVSPFTKDESSLVPPETVQFSDTQLNMDALKTGWRIAYIYGPDQHNWFANLRGRDDDHVVRGVNDEEMRCYLETGAVQSRGDLVKDIGQKHEFRFNQMSKLVAI